MPLPPSVFDEIYRRHGHRCPMSTLGGRLGHAARRRLGGLDAPELRAVYHARTCAADGVALTTGCAMEEGSLTVEDHGRHVLHLVRAHDGEGVEVTLREAALDLAGEYQKLRAEPATEAELEALLERLRSAPEKELLAVRPISREKQGRADA